MGSDLDSRLLTEAERKEPAFAGPATVVTTRREGSGRTVYSVEAQRLVPVADDDPALRDVSIAVPARGEVEVGPDGSISRVSLASADAGSVREARAFARNLIASGAVRGLGPATGPVRRGPPLGRPTHEVRTDPAGRKVIKRIGFDISGRSGPST